MATLAATALLATASPAQAFSFTGTSCGEWAMPALPSQSTLLSNQDSGISNHLEWGQTAYCTNCTPFKNYVQYDGVSFNVSTNTLFNLGNLTYRNGSTWDGFNGDFPLHVSLSLSYPFTQTQTFDFAFNILNTPNVTGDSVEDGDKLRFASAGLSGQTFNYAGVDYTLKLSGFSTDGGKTILSEFNSPEGSAANASLYGQITAVLPADTTSVPEPASGVGLTLLGVYLTVRRRAKNKLAD
ncbi:choice-of-anchor K domain-containing protein [Microcoleus sp. FACHB-672]|uniref:choice-of-anchor K domain-containing protein n=1 Tax=Microcoleus sp. FACHB-672 TaxID=2692825 RepID=UPI001683CC15|nr:choice-of-anchor K domain-containing protein [Microcoleus sp. FACHB-672]MBD2043348.1 PEP-CTERM sorting domain-containing protein [Microcoleus sp. FACHB-672]